MQLLDTPFIHCWVKDRFLYNGDETKKGLTEGYIFAVTCLFNRALLFSVHLKTGAVFSRLPINAFLHEKIDNHDEFDLEQLEPWLVMADKHAIIEHRYFKEYDIIVRAPEFQGKGRYVLTIDAIEGGFAQHPYEHKTFNIIAMENGHFAAMPNNFCIFKDEHFTDTTELPHYRRNTNYWRGPN